MKNTNKPKSPEKDGARKPSGLSSTKRLKHLPGCKAANKSFPDKWVACTCK